MEQTILKIFEPYTEEWHLRYRLPNGLVQVGEKDITHTPINELEMTFNFQEELGRTWEILRMGENHELSKN